MSPPPPPPSPYSTTTKPKGGFTEQSDFANIDDKTKAVFDKKGYTLMSKIGNGAFGQVYKARNDKRGFTVCAAKVMDMTKMTDKVRDKFLPRELAALMEVRHPYAVRVYDIFKMNKKVYIFMEYAGNGDLSAAVKNSRNKRVEESQAKVWFCQSCQAVAYMHNDLKMAHRDIKLDNILLDNNQNVKLTDFGFARQELDSSPVMGEQTSPCGTDLSVTYCGTVPYYSPQLVTKCPYQPFLADVWALGVVLYAMLCGRFPFHYQSSRKMYHEQTDYPRYIRGRFYGNDGVAYPVTDLSQQLVEWIFTPEEKDRPTMNDVLGHSWLTGG